ncbi:aldehyde oxidase [Mesorhizobium sp. Root552]|uniref:xanthine dehydrogenase molybdopterin binding subunit n=1 Tax=Mesorhizobium sp. Root552 TaxID=1736555 RepID=UPI0006FE1ABF|nr:xanthine dehydrogenase molybdopterin binding subunit [Mesorhizobium sp. Root552]KQZ29475.1 aldehyde oxidase [Mesorhizobium sp. Root552]
MPKVIEKTLAAETIKGGVHQRIIHDSAFKHVTGQAQYVDDLPEPRELLHVFIAQSQRAHARLVKLDVEAVRRAPGVATVLTAADVPGENDFGHAHCGDEPVFASDTVVYFGQPIFAVAADTVANAREAARLAVVEYEDLEPILTVRQAMERKSFLGEPMQLVQGDWEAALAAAPHRAKGSIEVGGQEHFYLEGQASLALLREDGDVYIHCATQDPSAVQHMVARVLGRDANAVTIEVRRMGGAFGGKETGATQFASIAALVAVRTRRPAKVRLDRDDDMVMTGKRHDFCFDYDVGFDTDGRILSIDIVLMQRAGYSHDQSRPVLQRTIYNCDNAYFLPSARLTGYACRTNTQSNTAFRGFGSPQGNLVIERVMDEIAYALGKEPFDVRMANLYGESERNVTPYDWVLKDNILPRIVDEALEVSDFAARRQAVVAFNRQSRIVKRGIALMPLKYPVGFSARFLNQAGALVHIYQDGSIHLNHGGTEMGQGLFIKVAQVVAEEFQVDVDRIKITATVTDKVPNTTATAASSGTDMNGAAAQIAARAIKTRLIDFAAEHYKVGEEQIVFEPNRVRVGNQLIPFDALVKQAYENLISLSAFGYYRNPDIAVDPVTMKGRAYHYCCYGTAVVEVAIDTLTGENRVQRVDIVHDVGKSLNPTIDMGQLEGGFVQGMGWVTSEELVWDDRGRLRTHAPSTYKIPVCSDRPKELNMRLVDWSRNRENTVYRSKAIGEPPFNLAISVFNALTDAVASVGNYRFCPDLDAPATPERILMACDALRRRLAAEG